MAGTGDVSADDFADSYRTSIGQVVSLFRAKGVPPEEAADLAHETLLRTLVHLKRHGRDRTDLGPLVRTIARNLLIERARRNAPQLVPLSDEIDVATTDLGPAEQMEATERRDAVRRAVAGLSPRHRHAVRMWMDGKTPAEIGRELGIKRNAVDAILHRARRSLAAKLDGNGAFGVFGLAALRARVLLRRATDLVSKLDPSGQFIAASGGIAVFAAAAVLTTLPAAVPASHAPAGSYANLARTASTGAASPTRTISSATPLATTGSTSAKSDSRPPRAEVKADLRNEAVSANLVGDDKKTGEQRKLGVDVWQSRDSDHPGVVGPIIDTTTSQTCDNAVVCGGKR